MKTLRLFLSLAIFSLMSCETEIPEVDTTPPTFSFEISGDGFNHTFTQDDDFSSMQLNLRANTEFSFVYTCADQGGLALAQWFLGDDNEINFITPEFPFESWTVLENPAVVRRIQWTGDLSDPRLGAVLSGRFMTGNVNNGGNNFRFFARDFGGEAGVPNQTTATLNIFIGNFQTELRTF